MKDRHLGHGTSEMVVVVVKPRSVSVSVDQNDGQE